MAILKAEIDSRERDINGVYQRIEKRRESFSDTPEGMDSMAYQIHNLYSAFEQLLNQSFDSLRTGLKRSGIT